MTTHHMTPPPLTTETLLRLADAELSLRVRVAHIALLLVSLLMTTSIVSLWLTEPSLPIRTHVAFGAMTVIGLAWTMFAARVLTERRVLYARHRVIAGRMAVTFTAAFVVGALAIVWTRESAAGYVAAGIGAMMLVAAVLLLRRWQRTLAQLIERGRVLEQSESRPR